MAKRKSTLPAPRPALNDSVLAPCFLQDPVGEFACVQDANMFGAYMTGDNGAICFQQCRRVAPKYVQCKTAFDLDRLLWNLLFVAAKHVHRYITTTDLDADS